MRAEDRTLRTVYGCHSPDVPAPARSGGMPERFSQAVMERRDSPARNRSAICRITAACSGMRMPPGPYP